MTGVRLACVRFIALKEKEKETKKEVVFVLTGAVLRMGRKLHGERLRERVGWGERERERERCKKIKN
jgi:hypothetical protein